MTHEVNMGYTKVQDGIAHKARWDSTSRGVEI